MEEPKDFISWIGIVPDPRIIGMVIPTAVIINLCAPNLSIRWT